MFLRITHDHLGYHRAQAISEQSSRCLQVLSIPEIVPIHVRCIARSFVGNFDWIPQPRISKRMRSPKAQECSKVVVGFDFRSIRRPSSTDQLAGFEAHSRHGGGSLGPQDLLRSHHELFGSVNVPNGRQRTSPNSFRNRSPEQSLRWGPPRQADTSLSCTVGLV